VQALMQQYFGAVRRKMDPKSSILPGGAQADIAWRRRSLPCRRNRAHLERRSRRLEIFQSWRGSTSTCPPRRRSPRRHASGQDWEEVTDLVDYRPGCLFRRQDIRPVYRQPSHSRAPADRRPCGAGRTLGPGWLRARGPRARFQSSPTTCRFIARNSCSPAWGPPFTRQAMGQWVGHSTLLLLVGPIPFWRTDALAGRYIQMDETPVSVLDPERAGRPATPGVGSSFPGKEDHCLRVS